MRVPFSPLPLPTLPRHVMWRRLYDDNRYGRSLTDLELKQRIDDLIYNLLTLTSDGKLGIIRMDNRDNTAIAEKLTHMLEEMQLRHGPYPAGFDGSSLKGRLAGFASAVAREAGGRFSSISSTGGMLVKFGKKQYMESLINFGSMRIQPASYFLSKEHNAAIRDDEQRFGFTVTLERDEVVKLVKNPQDVPEIIPDQRVDFNAIFGTDYWVYCLTTAISDRLFIDFEADSCVIVKNPGEFRKRLQRVTEVHSILSRAEMRGDSAKYLDPLFPSIGLPDIPFVKHFKYAYQKEHRFCWIPRSPLPPLSHVDIEIGNLRGIADIVELK
jgi:hypothetical protein